MGLAIKVLVVMKIFYILTLSMSISCCSILFLIFKLLLLLLLFFFFFLFRAAPWHMEVPRLRVELELRLLQCFIILQDITFG